MALFLFWILPMIISLGLLGYIIFNIKFNTASNNWLVVYLQAIIIASIITLLSLLPLSNIIIIPFLLCGSGIFDNKFHKTQKLLSKVSDWLNALISRK